MAAAGEGEASAASVDARLERVEEASAPLLAHTRMRPSRAALADQSLCAAQHVLSLLSTAAETARLLSLVDASCAADIENCCARFTNALRTVSSELTDIVGKSAPPRPARRTCYSDLQTVRLLELKVQLAKERLQQLKLEEQNAAE
jgi:hypothetical protein